MRAILVIEDDDDSRTLLADVLNHYGYRTATARNGLEGLTAARAEAPAVILLDLHMPIMDGIAFRKQQLRDPALATVPVICVSALDCAPQLAAQLGAVEFVGKPIDFDRLLRVVHSLAPAS